MKKITSRRKRDENPRSILGHVKKGLGINYLISQISNVFLEIPDKRQKKKIKYSIRDSLMCGLAMMFFQDPSLLQFQKRMQKDYEKNNLASLFDVFEIPADTQMRNIIDNVPSEEIEKIFSLFFKLLQRGKQLEQFLFHDNNYLIAIDGTQIFTSEDISCDSCLTKKSEKGKTRHHHQILQAVMIHPKMKQVIPIASEPIQNKDGTDKQDCEINAAKRLLKRIRKMHPKLKIMILGDGLFSHQPFIKELLEQKMSFTLVAKPKDHKVMFKNISNRENIGKLQELEVTDSQGNLHIYRWTNFIDINGNQNTEQVNYFEYELFNTKKDKVTFRNSWVTNIIIGKENVEKFAQGGRTRWKIENETFNTLKNQGYHVEHNFGHGKKNLCTNYYLLNLIAFSLHEILQLSDKSFSICRKSFATRIVFFNNLRIVLSNQPYSDWYQFIAFVYEPKLARENYPELL